MFYVYATESGLIKSHFETEHGARISKAALEKREAKWAAKAAANGWSKRPVDVYDVCSDIFYDKYIRRTKVVKNMMSGKELTIDINTPRCCDPSSELYWTC